VLLLAQLHRTNKGNGQGMEGMPNGKAHWQH